MKLYLYNVNHLKEYLGELEGDEAKYQFCATTMQPPTYEEHTLPCWDGAAWSILIDDYRGEIVYHKLDSRRNKQVYVAGPVDADYVVTPPPDTEKHYIWKNDQWEEYVEPVTPVTVQDYDDAMEAHLDAELIERGYTKRSPIEYTNSTNARWKQDAIDWQKHLDEVMTYGLEIMNKYEAGEPVPTLDEFKAALPQITWTVALVG